MQPDICQEYLYDEAPPVVTYQEAVTDVESQFVNKKYLHYDHYKDIVCHFCKKKGHPVKLCEETVDIDIIQDPDIRRLATFILHYPSNIINPVYGKYGDILLNLPNLYEKLKSDRQKFWNDFGYDNPFSDTTKYWSFGNYRRRDIGYLWAIGTTRVQLLKLVVGYESKTCIKIPRMRLRNHVSWDQNVHLALPVLYEYIQFGILRLVPPEFAEVILPMSVIVKPGKVRIVIDGKASNCYTPSMKFLPNDIDHVQKMIFPNARIQGADAVHAFYQLNVTTAQARRQCIQFIHPITGVTVTAAFFTEIFGSKLSCYRYVKMEDQINKYFRLCGIKFSDYYDDANFYSVDHSLFAGVMGSFIKRVYYHIGRQLNESKTDLLHGSYQAKHRGFIWNSRLMNFKATDKLINSTNEIFQDLFESVGKRKSNRVLLQLMGKCMYMAKGLTYMSILLSPIKDLLRLLHSRYSQDEIWLKSFTVSKSLVSHLHYIHQILKNGIIMPIKIPHCDIEIVTDASDRMAGSYDSLGKIVVVPLPEAVKLESSTYRECYGIYVALQNRLPIIRGKKVRILVDNLGSSTILMRNGSKVQQLNMIVYKIIKLCLDNHVYLWSKWLKRDMESIKWADDLSKCTESDRWIFDHELVAFFLKQLQLPPIEIDLLADDTNKIVPKYFSRYYDGHSIDFNWLRKNYTFFENQWCYLNPPFRNDYIAVAVDNIISKRINAYIILPIWPNALWYNKVLDNISTMIILQDGNRYFSSPAYMTARLSKKWNVMFLVFDFGETKKSYRTYKYVPEIMSLVRL